MIYELRRYSVALGRMRDMHARMERVLMPLFTEHGVPLPVGIWDAASGSSLPQLVWLLAWPDVQTRFEVWRRFYPVWRAVREEDASPEFVLRTDVSLLEPWSTEPLSFQGAQTAEDELWILRLRLGCSSAAKQTALKAESSALAAAGAAVVGGFDFMVGDLPQSALLLSWSDAEARRNAVASFEQAPPLAAQRASDLERYGTPIIERVDRILLERAPYRAVPGGPTPNA